MTVLQIKGMSTARYIPQYLVYTIKDEPRSVDTVNTASKLNKQAILSIPADLNDYIAIILYTDQWKASSNSNYNIQCPLVYLYQLHPRKRIGR